MNYYILYNISLFRFFPDGYSMPEPGGALSRSDQTLYRGRTNMSFKTADLCDNRPGKIKVVAPRLQSYGGNKVFSGSITTVKVHEDNVLVRSACHNRGWERCWW